MRKRLLCISAAFLIAFAGCSNAETQDTSSAQPNLSYPASQTTTNQTTVPIETTHPQLLAIDYLESIMDISSTWKDGRYLVYGTDRSGTPCYGVLSCTGTFELLDKYKFYYPLADGNLLVTNEETETDFQEICCIPNGSILDKQGNVYYAANSDDSYQKMYVVNSETILVIAASSGFDGMELSWGILDHTGNWVKELSSTGLLIERIAENDLIYMNADGSWDYSNIRELLCFDDETGEIGYKHQVMEITTGKAYDSKENQSLIFRMETGFDGKYVTEKVIAFSSASNDFFEFELQNGFTDSFQQVTDSQWLQKDTIFSGLENSSVTYNIYEESGAFVNEIRNYITTDNGIKYWAGSWEDQTLYSDEHPDGIKYPESIASKIQNYLDIQDEKVYMLLKGNDDLDYLAIGDLNGNLIQEPFRPDSFSPQNAIISDGVLAFYNREEETVYAYILSDDTLTSICQAADNWGYIDSIRFLADDLIAVEVDSDQIKVYTIDGHQIG